MARTSFHRIAFFLAAPALVLCFYTVPTAADDGAQQVDFTAMAELAVVLTDEEGNAIAGAEVMPYAMRVVEVNGHGFWNRELLGPPTKVISDEAGVAVIQYPVHIQRGPQVLTTRLVTFEITHTDFVKKVVHFDLGPERAEVTLKAGCEVRLSALDPEGNAVDDFGVVMAGPYEPDAWAKADSGGRRTRSINDGTWQAMLVKLQDDGPTLFSDVLPLRVRPQQTVQVRNVRLMPGAKVRGTLSDNVSRPVTGYVVATSVPSPAKDSWDEENPSLAWHDWVEVREDGSFEFESLPRGGKLQLIGICEGWISSTTVPDARVFVMGQMFDVNDDDVQIELEMEPTGTLEIHLFTEDGEPFTEGRVTSWPNQAYFKGGSTILGQRYRSATQVKNQLLPSDQRLPIIDESLAIPFDQPVGEDGVAVLSGLPIGRSERLVLAHDRFTFVEGNKENGLGELRFELPSPEPVRMNVTVAPAEN